MRLWPMPDASGGSIWGTVKEVSALSSSGRKYLEEGRQCRAVGPRDKGDGWPHRACLAQPGRSGPVALEPLRDHQDVAVQGLDVLPPAQGHGHVQFLVDDLQRLGHAFLSHRAQAIDEGAADIGAPGPHRERLQHVLAGAYATVEMDFDLVADGIEDRGQGTDRR